MSKLTYIYNANIVTPSKVIENGSIVIDGETIIAIEEHSNHEIEGINANGSWVLPGLVDSHSDAIEMEMEPRPSSAFPIEVSFYELEKKLVGEGITTIYHSMSLYEENAQKWIRRNDTVLNAIKDIKRLAQGQHLIRHKTHLRYEITNVSAVTAVQQLIEQKQIDQLSFMDHTPGQGQFRDMEVHKKLLIEHRRYTEEQANELINESKQLAKIEPAVLQQLAALATQYGIALASHDDDTVEKLVLVKSWNASISEFPIELEVARKAKELGLYVVMGAPNVLLGKSHSNNLSAMEAIEAGLVDILCSDYYPSSLLHTVFKLYHLGMPINQAVNMVSLNPARALNIDYEVGSIEVGKKADLLVISEMEQRPVLEKVLLNGQIVCEMKYHTPLLVNQ